MSDTTTLIHEYEVSRQLAERMNQASLAMKRARRPGTVPNADVGDARKEAAATLALVLQMLRPQPEATTPQGEIPQDLIEDFRGRYGGEMPYLLRDLANAVESLKGGEISPDAIAVIDKLCRSADSVASASFRRLRRR
jgi:hypothetical protein